MEKGEKPSLLAKKDWRVLGLAVLLGIIAVFLMNAYVSSRSKREELVSVVVAHKKIEVSTILEEGMLTKAKIPKCAAPEGIIKGYEKKRAVGSRVAIHLVKGQPLYWNFLMSPGMGDSSGFGKLPVGQRAFSITFDNPLADAVVPGDYIDIYGTHSRGEKKVEGFQLLARVPVIYRAGEYLVLKVSPDEALLLWVARKVCSSITFAVRGEMEMRKDSLLVIGEDDILRAAQKISKSKPSPPSKPKLPQPEPFPLGGARGR